MSELENLTEDEQLNIGARAKALLEDEILTFAFHSIEERLIDEWINSAPDQVETREHLHDLIHALSAVRGWLEEAVSNAEMVNQSRKH